MDREPQQESWELSPFMLCQVHVLPCGSPPVSTSHNSDGMLLSLLALCCPFPCPPDHKPAPLVCLHSGDVPPKGRRLNSFLWISFLLLSDAFQAEACRNSAPVLLNTCNPLGLDPTSHFTSKFSTLHRRHQSRHWPDPDLGQTSAGLGVSHH